ncbi:hypothetical protein Tco_0622030 [Tanacetum coccineum]
MSIEEPMSDEILREMCDKNYHQLLPLIAEPMSDEVLREMCDKNYHQLLPLIAEKMQKEKEQKDKLNAVKARLIYGEESGVKIRSHEESHYSESKTPTARTEPRRRRGDRYSRSPSPHASVFKRLKKNRSYSPRPRPRKEGGVFNRLGRKEPATSARLGSRQRSPQAKRTEVEARRRQQKGTPSHCGHLRKKILSTPRIRHFSLRGLDAQPWGKNYLQQNRSTIKAPGGDTSSSKDGRIYGRLHAKRYKAGSPGRGGALDLHEISGFMARNTHPGLIKASI